MKKNHHEFPRKEGLHDLIDFFSVYNIQERHRQRQKFSSTNKVYYHPPDN